MATSTLVRPTSHKAVDTGPAALAAGLLMSLPFLLPWHPLPIPSFYAEWSAMALGLLVLGALVLPARAAARQAFHIPFVALAPAALAAVLLLQLALGIAGHPVNVLVAVLFLAWSCLLAIAASSAAQRGGEAHMATLAWFLLGGGLAGAACGLAQYTGLYASLGGLVIAPRPLDLYGVFGNLAQQNHFATHLALAMAALAFLRANARIGARPALAAAVVLAGAMALSGSRSVLLYLAWIGMVWLLATRAQRGRRLLLGAGVVLLIGTALLIAARMSLLGPQLARLVLFSEGAGPRLFYWQHALAMAADHPFLGVGIDRFATALIGQLQPGEKTWAIDQYAHNEALQLLATTGIAGFAAVAVPLSLFARRLLRAGVDAQALLPWGVLGVLFIHSMLEQPLHFAYFLAVAAYIAGAADPGAWEMRRLRRGLGIAAGAGFAALLLTAFDFRTLSESFYGADSVSIGGARHRELIATLHRRSLFAPYAELIAPQVFVPAGATPQDSLAFNQRVRQFAPIADVEYRHAALLAQAGQLEAAKAQFALAARAYPEESAAYAQRLVLMAPGDPVTGKLAVFALEVAQQAGP